MTDKLRVGVLFGGRSGEHEVSLNSARSILHAIDRAKYSVTQIGISQDGLWLAGMHADAEDVHTALVEGKLDGLQPVALLPDPMHSGLYAIKDGVFEHFADLDVIFPVLHGTFGEDGTLQGLFELNGIAYVGAGVVGSAVGMDKAIFKDLMRAHGLPIVPYQILLRSQVESDLEGCVQKAMQTADFPLFIKPVNLGSSVGITKCHSRADVLEALLEAARYDRRILVERGIPAREIEISVLGNNDPIVSNPGEIIPSREFYSYEAKYTDNLSKIIIPAPLPEEMIRRVQQYALQAYQIADCAGMARVDFLLDREQGDLYLSEINTIPGFTQISMYPKLWDAAGLHYPMLVDRLLELALERKADRQRTVYRRMVG